MKTYGFDMKRWHVSPFQTQTHDKVEVCRLEDNNKTGRVCYSYVRRICFEHDDFRYVSECIYSRRMGPGYEPGDDERLPLMTYWQRLAWLKRRAGRTWRI